MLISLLKKWVDVQCSPDKGKPLAGSQLSFAVRTIKAALNGDGKATKKANHSS